MIALSNAGENASTLGVVDSKHIAQMATLLRRRIEVLEHYPLPEVLQNSLVPDQGFSRGLPIRAFLF